MGHLDLGYPVGKSIANMKSVAMVYIPETFDVNHQVKTVF